MEYVVTWGNANCFSWRMYFRYEASLNKWHILKKRFSLCFIKYNPFGIHGSCARFVRSVFRGLSGESVIRSHLTTTHTSQLPSVFWEDLQQMLFCNVIRDWWILSFHQLRGRSPWNAALFLDGLWSISSSLMESVVHHKQLDDYLKCPDSESILKFRVALYCRDYLCVKAQPFCSSFF